MKKILFLSLVSLLVLWAWAPSYGGFVQVDKYGSTTYIQDGKIKTVTRNKTDPWTVMDLKNDRITVVNPDSQQYTQISSAEYCGLMEEMQGKAAAFKQGFQGRDKGRSPRVSVVDEGPGGKIAGLETTKYKVLKNDKLTEELWLTQDPALLNELADLQNMDFMQCSLDRPAEISSQKYTELLSQGWPLKRVYYSRGQETIDIEVVKIEEKNISSSEFQPPQGYTQVSWSEFVQAQTGDIELPQDMDKQEIMDRLEEKGKSLRRQRQE